MKRVPTIIALALGLLVIASACNSTDSLFDEANEHTNQGMTHLVSATQYSQNGDQERAQEELDLSKSEFRQAIAKFEEVLTREPEHVSAMINMGAAYYNLGELDKAIAQYEQALELEPDDAGVHSNLAAAYFQLGDTQGALREYELAAHLDPDMAEAHFGLGVTYMILNQPDEAIDAFERFQALDDGDDPIASQQAGQYLQQLREE